MNYSEAIQFLYGLQQFGAELGLERTEKLAALAGNPQARLQFIHVAGTNGKGSTCAILESIYRASGLRVGLFTSPHLISFRERIQIDRKLISEAEIVRLVGEIKPQLNNFSADNHPTMFEVVTVMALKFFAEQQCDLVIWETGLGGRLDATNVVTPLASVITNIAFDHEQWLGDTLAKIAAEKAGIIKSKVPVVTTETQPEALCVIEQAAREKIAPITRVAERSASNFQPSTALIGDHQKSNTALAVAVVEVLRPQFPVRPDHIQTGLSQVNWPGRLQLIERANDQKILLDGAHNVAGTEVLRRALVDHFPARPRVFIVGALADKQWATICRTLAPLATRIFTVPVASKRTATAEELAKEFAAASPATPVTACDNLAAALAACQGAPFIVITGSLYLVGEALELLGCGQERAGERGLNEWAGVGKR